MAKKYAVARASRPKLSFKRGTVARRARSLVAERIKAKGDRSITNPFAVASSAVKRMSPKARYKLAQRRRV